MNTIKRAAKLLIAAHLLTALFGCDNAEPVKGHLITGPGIYECTRPNSPKYSFYSEAETTVQWHGTKGNVLEFKDISSGKIVKLLNNEGVPYECKKIRPNIKK